MKILAIDSGNTESGYALVEMPEFKLIAFGKAKNGELLERLKGFECDEVALEMVASYGMSVGKSVFQTCVWIGRFWEALKDKKVFFVYRKDEKMALCGRLQAKDSNIRQALVDRYAKHDMKNGKGTKKSPDTFYGVSKDAWQAIAVAVTHYEQRGKYECEQFE